MRVSLVLYCCTFAKDLTRALRLADSVKRHNVGGLKFYFSVPEDQLALFREAFAAYDVTILNERDILRANPKLDIEALYKVPGSLRQQVIKSEFWRLDLCENYLVLDADCVFIRDFTEQDFFATADVPYSILHEGKDLFQPTDRFWPRKTREEFTAMAQVIQKELQRPGVTYHFGCAPFLWSRKVWESLDTNYLTPRGENFFDAVCRSESEFTWYGEALMAYRAIPLYPREQLFKHYHYEHQYWLDRAIGYTEASLAKDYLGVVYQSNWQTWEDHAPTKSAFSRAVRSTKRFVKKVRFKAMMAIGLVFG